MSDAINSANEPVWLTDWRRVFKKKCLRPGESLDKYQQSNTPFDYEKFKKTVNYEVLKGNIPQNLVEQILEWAKEKDGAIEEVPPYESPLAYHHLKQWSEKIELAIPRCIKLEDNVGNKEDFTLKNSVCIITSRTNEFGGLNAGSGHIEYPESDGNYYYIVFDPLFVDFIIRISNAGSRLFNISNIKGTGNFKIKQLVDNNLENDHEIYKCFRDAFFHFMFYGNENVKNENVRKMLGDEIFINMLGFLPPPDLKANLYFSIGSRIEEAMGLFIMGHEYAHLLLHYIFNATEEYITDIQTQYQKEFQADELALQLMFNCINYGQDDPKTQALGRLCFVGVDILFTCLYIIDYMSAVLSGNDVPIVYDDHPPTKRRIDLIRQYYEKLKLPPSDIDFLDAVDYVFQKLRDHFINELSNNEHIKKYIEGVKLKKQKLISEMFDLLKRVQNSINTYTGLPNDLLVKAAIGKCEEVLKNDPNNVQALFALGSIYCENHIDVMASECFFMIVNIIAEDIDNNRPFDRSRYYASLYYVGYYYTQEVVSILQNCNYNPNSDQASKVAKLLDTAIEFFTIAIPHYNHGGAAFHYLGVALAFKNEHEKAIENFDKALQYQPDNMMLLEARQRSLLVLTGIPGLNLDNSSNNMFKEIFTHAANAAETGDPKEQFSLGLSYENGLGVPIDLEKAVFWYKKAADNGHAEAQYFLGGYYRNGKTVKQDIKEAVVLYTKAAEQGYVYAQYDLGTLYAYGIEGVIDLQKSFYWFKKAADQGDAPSLYYVGLFYENGYIEPKDLTKAVYWHTKAAEKGEINAQVNLSLLLYNEGNKEEAVTWFTRAAEQGNAQSQFNLGAVYYYGDGITQNIEKAIFWLQKAASQGHAKAQEFLKNMTSHSI